MNRNLVSRLVTALILVAIAAAVTACGSSSGSGTSTSTASTSYSSYINGVSGSGTPICFSGTAYADSTGGITAAGLSLSSSSTTNSFEFGRVGSYGTLGFNLGTVGAARETTSIYGCFQFNSTAYGLYESELGTSSFSVSSFEIVGEGGYSVNLGIGITSNSNQSEYGPFQYVTYSGYVIMQINGSTIQIPF